MEVLLEKKLFLDPQTLWLQFERPRGYSFEPGQYAYLSTLKKTYPDNDHHQRMLSFASSPEEATLDFLLRVRPSGFKRELVNLKVGEPAGLTSPMGSFSFPEESEPVVAITGGVGIAPFISLIKHHLAIKKTFPLTLLWSNQTEALIPLRAQVDALGAMWPNWKQRLFLTRQAIRPLGTYNRITPQWLMRNDIIQPNACYMVSGPPTLADQVTEYLLTQGVSGSQIKMEAFTGY